MAQTLARHIYQPAAVWVLCSYHRGKNQCDFLMRSNLNNTAFKDHGTFSCVRSQCNSWAHTNTLPTINSPRGQITINYKYTCNRSNMVYVIKWSTSGETGRRMWDQFREHLRSTRQTTDLQLGQHFSLPGHNSGFDSGFWDTLNRHCFKARMIFQHKTLHAGCLNGLCLPINS